MVVEAPVDVVWSLVTDISLPARFSTEFCGATWIDPPALGARFHGRSRHDALGEWETVSFVSRYESPKAFAWDVGDPDNPVNYGKLCSKAGKASIEQLYQPARIDHPMIRDGEKGSGRWRRAS